MYYFEEIAQVEDVLNYKKEDACNNGGLCALSVTATFQQLIEFLNDNKIGLAMLYEDENDQDATKEIVGVISERDVIRQLALYGQEAYERPLSAIMSTDIETCYHRDHLKETAARMADKKLRHMVVTNAEGEVVGLISSSDIEYFAGKG